MESLKISSTVKYLSKLKVSHNFVIRLKNFPKVGKKLFPEFEMWIDVYLRTGIMQLRTTTSLVVRLHCAGPIFSNDSHCYMPRIWRKRSNVTYNSVSKKGCMDTIYKPSANILPSLINQNTWDTLDRRIDKSLAHNCRHFTSSSCSSQISNATTNSPSPVKLRDVDVIR